MKNNKGMALIMAVAIVGILAGIAATFAYNMRIDQKAAGNYLYMVKARYLAEAGIARALAELKNDAQSSSWLISRIDRLYNSDLGEVWADGSTISGPGNGALGEGYFDFRYKRTIAGTGDVDYDQLDETSGVVNGHVINGIIDEERKININYANATLLNGLPKLSGLGSTIVTDRTTNGNFNSIAELMRLTEIDRNHLYGDDDGKGVGGDSAPKANNHKMDSSYENDEGSDNILDGGVEDLITVYTDYITDGDGSSIISPVNVNTASESVLKAVIGGISGVSSADRDTVVQAILDYRRGTDDLGNAIGDGNPNPFDGIDQNRNDASDLDPSVSVFADPGGDNLDNDGDGTADEPDEEYMFAGGARGEFNALLDHLISSGYNGGGTISSADAVDIMNNADPADNVDYNGDGSADNNVWTTSFIFNSKYFQIISTGVVERGGAPLAEQKLMEIIGPIE